MLLTSDYLFGNNFFIKIGQVFLSISICLTNNNFNFENFDELNKLKLK